MKFDVGRRVEHRPDREIDVALAQQGQPGLARDVVQSHVDLRILARVLLDKRRQQILNRRAARRDVHRPALHRFPQRRKALIELVDRLHERPRQLQQPVPVVRQFDPRPAALKKLRPQLLLQRLDLQRHRWLAQPHLLRRLRNALRAPRSKSPEVAAAGFAYNGQQIGP